MKLSHYKDWLIALLFFTVAKFVNFILFWGVGGQKRPVFFGIDTIAPSLRELDKAYPVIRHEVENMLSLAHELPQYHDLDPTQKYISGKGGKKWTVFMLYAMGVKPQENRELCPHTCKALDKIPHLFQAFFSILEGGKHVPAHPGPYLGYLRYHLGIKVPAENPPSIRIKDQRYTWEEGKSILFDDSWEHEVTNNSTEDRVVLIVDVLRPLPPYLHALNHFFAYVVVRALYGKAILEKNLRKFI